MSMKLGFGRGREYNSSSAVVVKARNWAMMQNSGSLCGEFGSNRLSMICGANCDDIYIFEFTSEYQVYRWPTEINCGRVKLM